MEHYDANQQPLEQSTQEILESSPVDLPKQTVGFWEYFGLTALFAIPVVGWIVCAVFMFAPKRKSIKNFARAILAWTGIGLATTATIVLLLFNTVANYVLQTSSYSDNKFRGVFELIEVADDVMNGEYTAIIDALRPRLLKTFGKQYEPLLDELSKDKYNDLIKKIVAEDYAELLNDFQSGKYEELEQLVDQREFAEFMNELEAASNGKPSELFDNIKTYLPTDLIK